VSRGIVSGAGVAEIRAQRQRTNTICWKGDHMLEVCAGSHCWRYETRWNENKTQNEIILDTS